MESDISERATGTPPHEWLGDQLAESRTTTDQPLAARLIYWGPKFRVEVAQTDIFEQVESITDPNALKRFIGHGIAEMVRNLSKLTFAARLVIPGLREMTPAEHHNLRQYYKKLYRKA